MWLEEQRPEKLKEFLRRTAAPMLATMDDGEILWCNQAFESLLGWTSVELVGRLTWKDLTADKDELENDIKLVQEAVLGQRERYGLQKPYRTKNGAPKRCVIDVLRYPSEGELECFLVTVLPVDNGIEFALGQLNEIHKFLVDMVNRETAFEKAMKFVEKHPVIGGVALTLLATLLFGERVIQIIKMFGIKVGE